MQIAWRLLLLLPFGRQPRHREPLYPTGLKQSFLRRMLPTATGMAVLITSLLGLSAVAVAAEEEAIKEAVVTGSRISRIDSRLREPVQIYKADYIANTGAVTSQDFLFTANLGGPDLFNENSTLSQHAGTATFNSRGFTDDYVVILQNG